MLKPTAANQESRGREQFTNKGTKQTLPVNTEYTSGNYSRPSHHLLALL